MPERINLAEGSGGQATQALIDRLFMRYFSNPLLECREDQARLPIAQLAVCGDRLAYSTDSFVIDPLIFPGGDIGKLSICGTANDIAMSGARPQFLSCGFILEEGLSLECLHHIVRSMAQSAQEANIQIVTGDTKVVPKGAADKLFINTSGLGVIPDHIQWGARNIEPGDRIIVSGTLGDHGATILNLREALGFSGHLLSDCRHLYPLVESLLPVRGVKTLRDATRGGVNAVLHEFCQLSGCGFELDESALPVTPEVRAICELLGLDAVNFANEGKLIAIVSREDTDLALTALQQTPGGEQATVIGEATLPAQITMKNAFGGHRWLDLPAGEPMPRIC